MTTTATRPRTALHHATARGGPDARSVLTTAWSAGLVVTALVWRFGETSRAVYAPDVHLVVDTIDGVIAAVVCALLVARARRTRTTGDRLLAEVFGLLAVASLVLSLGNELVGDPSHALTWTQASLRNGAILLLLLAVLSMNRRSRRRWRPRASAAVLVVSTVVGATTWSGRDVVQVVHLDERHLVLHTHALLTATIAVGAVLAIGAAVLLDRRQRRGDLLLGGWLAPALVTLAFARVHYVFFPSYYSHYVFSGDVLRTAGYVLLLVGAVREVVDHWSAETREATEEERRRLARELHDGAVQEMVLARLDAVGLVRQGVAATALVESIDRALDEVRSAVDDLVLVDEDLEEVVTHVALGTGRRLGVQVEVVCDSVPASALLRHDVARVVREAVSNAVRHGRARLVTVSLRHVEGRIRLRVEDDGTGFDTSAPRTGFGLVSMRDRAARAGGRLDVVSVPGVGTVVELTW